MHKPIVFFSRCKPNGSDAIDVALENNRVFIGYPLLRSDVTYDPLNLQSCVANPSGPDEDWRSAHVAARKKRPEYNRNRNLVKSVVPGSIALVPRPSGGVIFCGVVEGGFRLENAPPWSTRYLDIRRKQKLAVDSDHPHAADVAQCWMVDRLRPIPVTRLPPWIRRSLFGRSTYGVIRKLEEMEDEPYDTIQRILGSAGFQPVPWTVDRAEIERRLLDNLTPSSFEHLVVSLLQLEHRHETWSQVGGPGDGGIDGVGAAHDGAVAALLQCKWQYDGQETFPNTSNWISAGVPFRRYLAALLYPKNFRPVNGIEFLDRSKVADLMIRHHARLPEAIAMRVGGTAS